MIPGGMIVLVLSLIFVANEVRGVLGDNPDIAIVAGSVSADIVANDNDDTCTWLLAFSLENLTDDGVSIKSFGVVPRPRSFRVEGQYDTPPEKLTDKWASQLTYRLTDCSSGPADLD